MELADKEQFVRNLTGLLESFQRTASEATFRGYWIGLSDLDIGPVVAGIQRSIRESRLMPSPAELRVFCGAVDPADMSIMAWSVVLKSIGIGPYRSVCFDDGVVNATIRNLGGWPRLFESLRNRNDEYWYRHNFVRTYAALARSSVNGDACQYLAGLHPVGVWKICRRGEERIVANKVRMIVTGLPVQTRAAVPRIPIYEDGEIVSGYTSAVQRIEFHAERIEEIDYGEENKIGERDKDVAGSLPT